VPVGAAEPTVAVLYFDYDGTSEAMGHLRKGLTQMLVSDLAGLDGFQFVERTRLQAVLAELDLGGSGKIDPASASQVGRLLGARYLIVGGYFDLHETLRIDARIVAVETGAVVAATGQTGPAQDFLALEQAIAGELRRALAGASSAAPPAGADSDVGAEPAEDPRLAPRIAPARLSAATVARYGKALDALDRGDETGARADLVAVVDENPDFALAVAELRRLAE
jgi:TolB-like protein